MTTVIVDSERSRRWVPFAKQKLAQIKSMNIPAKTMAIEGFTISILALDGIEKIRIVAPPITSVVAGGYHAMVTDQALTLWTWGNNASGQLGLGDLNSRSTATLSNPAFRVRPAYAPHIATLSAGQNHSLAIRTDGTLWAWGNNNSGVLGLGDSFINRDTPTKVGTAKWKAITGGINHSVGIQDDGTLWAWGNNLNKELGLGDILERHSPVRVGTGFDWVSVNASLASYSLATRTDGTLWAWGANTSGQLGLGSTVNPGVPTQIGTNTWVATALGTHSLAIRSDGTLWAWGSNSVGQLGLGDTASRLSPTQVGVDTWAAVAAGGHSLAIRSDGTLWAWGYNLFGQLGLGDTASRLSPTQVGVDIWVSVKTAGPDAGDASSSYGVKIDGTLWAWGSNSLGQLGLGYADTSIHPLPEKVSTAPRQTPGMLPGPM